MRGRASRRANLLLAVYAAGLGACYSYAPPPAGVTPPAGADIRIALTDAGTAQLVSLLGPRVAFVEGTLMQTGSDSVVMRAAQTVGTDGRENAWNGERVAMPASAVASLRTRQIDRGRSALAAAAGIALLAVGIISFRTKTDDSSGRVVVQPPPSGQ